jgi:hypothetical protein
MFFGGDGIFVARLTGPGKVWLQSLTMPNLAHALAPYLSKDGVQANAVDDAGAGAAGAIASSVMKNFFGR